MERKLEVQIEVKTPHNNYDILEGVNPRILSGNEEFDFNLERVLSYEKISGEDYDIYKCLLTVDLEKELFIENGKKVFDSLNKSEEIMSRIKTKTFRAYIRSLVLFITQTFEIFHEYITWKERHRELENFGWDTRFRIGFNYTNMKGNVITAVDVSSEEYTDCCISQQHRYGNPYESVYENLEEAVAKMCEELKGEALSKTE